MRRSNISKAVTSALFAGGLLLGGAVSSVQAVPTASNLGVGDVLLFPYYTVENGFNSLFHITNHDPERTILAKVRFREHKNSEDVLDFTVILSPNDVFTGYLRTDDDGNLMFDKTDNTCTAPQGRNNDNTGYASNGNIQLLDGDFKPIKPDVDGSPLTGHVEVITMGAIRNENVSDSVISELQRARDAFDDGAFALVAPNGLDVALLTGSVLYQSLGSLEQRYVMEAYQEAGATPPTVVQFLDALDRKIAAVQVANDVAFGALHSPGALGGNASVPANCYTENSSGTQATGAASYFSIDKIGQLQNAVTPTVAGTAGGAVSSAIVNALSGHYTVLDFDGGIAGSSRPLTVRDASTPSLGANSVNVGAVTNPCGGAQPNLICGQFVAHYPVPNLANLNGIDPTVTGQSMAALIVDAINGAIAADSGANVSALLALLADVNAAANAGVGDAALQALVDAEFDVGGSLNGATLGTNLAAQVAGFSTVANAAAITQNVVLFNALERALMSEWGDTGTSRKLSNEYVQRDNDDGSVRTASEIVMTLNGKYVYNDKSAVGVFGVNPATGVPTTTRTTADIFAGGDANTSLDWLEVDRELHKEMFNDSTGCAAVTMTNWDREEQRWSTPLTIPSASGPLSPSEGERTLFCDEVNVLTFNGGVTAPSDASYDMTDLMKVTVNGTDELTISGWLSVDLTGSAHTPAIMTGFGFWRRNFGSVAANYAQLFDNVYGDANP